MSDKLKELAEAFGIFIASLQGRSDEDAKRAIEEVTEQMRLLRLMPDEDVKYLSKSPEKLVFDLMTYGRNDGTWEKIKFVRRLQRDNPPTNS